MKTLDRRGLLRGILFEAAAAGVAFTPIAATAMPLDDTQLPGALDGWIEKTQVWVARARVVAPGAASTAAGETRRFPFAKRAPVDEARRRYQRRSARFESGTDFGAQMIEKAQARTKAAHSLEPLGGDE